MSLADTISGREMILKSQQRDSARQLIAPILTPNFEELNWLAVQDSTEDREVPLDQSAKVLAYVIICLALAFTVWGIAAYIAAGEMTLALLFIGFFIFLVAFLIYVYRK